METRSRLVTTGHLEIDDRVLNIRIQTPKHGILSRPHFADGFAHLRDLPHHIETSQPDRILVDIQLSLMVVFSHVQSSTKPVLPSIWFIISGSGFAI